MKTGTITILLAVSSLVTFAQDTTNGKRYHNEFGVDATGFLKQFLNFNTQFGSYYSPTYYITYRRHFKSGNIRAALGGDYRNNQIQNAFQGDSSKLYNKGYSYYFRIGFEHSNELSKRWQVFYGIDFMPNYVYNKNDAPYWNGGYANGYENKTKIFGVAPLLGFRLWLNNRLSLSTEASLSLNWEQNKGHKYYIPVSGQYPPRPDDSETETKKVYTSFGQPLSVFITFEL